MLQKQKRKKEKNLFHQNIQMMALQLSLYLSMDKHGLKETVWSVLRIATVCVFERLFLSEY